jgi:hypothetical protein
MATNLTRSITGINNFGGAYWSYKRVKSDGTDLASPDTWHTGTYREKTTYTYQVPQKDIFDESGAFITTEQDNVKVEIKLGSLDASSNTLTFLKDETQGSYFAIYMQYNSPTKDTVKADLFAPICQIETGFNVTSPGKKVDISIKPLENSSAVALDPMTTSLSAYSVTSSLTAAASSYFVFNK